TKPRFAHTDNLVSYEPLLQEVLGGDGTGTRPDLVPAILALAPVLNTATIDGTTGTAPLRPVLIGTAKYLFDPGAAPPGLAYRDGHVSTVESDGTTPVARVTPYYLLADAFAHKRTALAAADVTQGDSWRTATSALVDQM